MIDDYETYTIEQLEMVEDLKMKDLSEEEVIW